MGNDLLLLNIFILIGTKFGNHAVTFALYIDALVRKVDPKKRTLSEYFQDEFAKPLGKSLRVLPVLRL